MIQKPRGVHVVTTVRHYKGKTYRSHLLRRSYREDGKVKKQTVANLTSLGDDVVELIRMGLRGERVASVDKMFEVIASPHHGHVQAVSSAMERLGVAKLIGSRPSRQRSRVLAMVAARILKPDSKLATTRWWHTTTIPATFDVADADEDNLYDAMDWLLERQERIEKRLAARHLAHDGLALYDLSSSYFEGVTCPLAALGHNRDGKKGKLQVNYGLLTNAAGIPVSVSVFKGNSGDPKTLLPQVDKLRKTFEINRFVMVGDRGMITQKQVDVLRETDGADWIAALRPEAIKKLVTSGAIQMGLFDDRNLFELTDPDFPGERLVACRNQELGRKRAHKRASLVEATAKELDKIRRRVGRGRVRGNKDIRARAGKILDGYKLGKHFKLDIRDDGFDFEIDRDAIATELAHQSGHSELASKRIDRCERLIAVISGKLDDLRRRTERGRLYGKENIGLAVGRIINKYKVGKHFKLDIRDDGFGFEIDQERITAEAALDGIYVVRTSLSRQRMSADEAVRSYKRLGQVERAFRSFKTLDLKVRPIRHRLENRVRAHIFLCMLAYYVHWHMLEAWRPLLFCDENQLAKATRDPVAPAQRSRAALRKVHSKTLDDGSPAHSFRTLLKSLSAIVRNVCRAPGASTDTTTFDVVTTPSPLHQRAYTLLQTIAV